MRNLPVGIAPNLGASGAVMGQIIVGIGKLVEHKIASLRHLGIGVVAGALDGVGQGYGCPKGFHGKYSLAGGIFGHRKFNFNAIQPRNHGQSNARVAAGGLNEFDAWLDFAALHCAAYHAVSGAVFDASAWVVAFEFAQYPHVGVWI